MVIDEAAACPCGSGSAFGACCGPVIGGERPARSAEELMRSRYSAFAVGEAGHLLASWAQETRPRRLVLDGGERWLRLRVLGASHAPGSDTALVEFVAVSERAGVRSRLHELSRFVRRGGRWFYLDGGIDPS